MLGWYQFRKEFCIRNVINVQIRFELTVYICWTELRWTFNLLCRLKLMLDPALLRPVSASIYTTNRMSDSALSNKCILSVRTESDVPNIVIQQMFIIFLFHYSVSRKLDHFLTSMEAIWKCSQLKVCFI